MLKVQCMCFLLHMYFTKESIFFFSMYKKEIYIKIAFQNFWDLIEKKEHLKSFLHWLNDTSIQFTPFIFCDWFTWDVKP